MENSRKVVFTSQVTCSIPASNVASEIILQRASCALVPITSHSVVKAVFSSMGGCAHSL